MILHMYIMYFDHTHSPHPLLSSSPLYKIWLVNVF
jgi:hypothetical protein